MHVNLVTAALFGECLSMALRDVTNTCTKYIPQIQLAAKYAPLIRRGKSLEVQACRSSFPEKRAAGDTHIDLWVDGRLYPDDPDTKCPPRFSTTKEYLEFLCHGESGMLGYTKHLKALGSDSSLRPIVQSLESSVSILQSRVTSYEHDI